MTRARLLSLALASALASVALVAAPAQAATVTLSGVIRYADGSPVSHLQVKLFTNPQHPKETSDITDDDGSYSISVEAGPAQFLLTPVDSAGSYNVSSSYFAMSETRVENVTLPARSLVTATVTEGDDGSPSPSAFVRGDRAVKYMTGSGGLNLFAAAFPQCTTDASGSCTLPGFRGGLMESFDVTGAPSRPTQSFGGMSTPNPTAAAAFVLAPAPAISGVVDQADGFPLAGATVEVLGSSSSTVQTGTDGSWSIRALPGGPYQVKVTTSVTAGGRTLPYEIDTDPFQHTASRTVDLTLAALDTVAVNVRSSNGVTVDQPWVQVIGDLSTKTGSTADGLAVTSYLNRNGLGAAIQCYPPYDGPCLLPVISGGTSGRLQVVPPLPAQYFPPAPTVPGQPRMLQLTDYATATSAGSQPGTVVAGVDQGDVPELTTSPITLPDGLDPVVGRINYRVTLPPGTSSALLTVNSPGTGANALFRQNPDGGLVLLLTGGGQSPAFDVVDGSAADSDGVVNGSVSGSVIPVAMAPLTITTTALPSAAAQKPYSVRLQGTGPGAPMIWSADPNFPLPTGLSLSSDGVLSGTAPALGSYTFRVLMKDSRGWQGPTTQQLTLEVDKVAVLTGSLPDGYVGGAYSSTLTFASGSLPNWTVASGALPPGLKLGASNGTISGTPTTAGTYAFDVVVKANGTTSQRRTLSITIHPMEIATASLPTVPVWGTYSQKLTTHGGKATLVWSVSGGSLPPGVVLSSAGALSGKPTTVGSYPVTFKVKDALGQVATRSLVITVTPMTITTSSLPNGKKGGYYSQLLTVSGGKATLAWSLASGSLPTGLTLSSAGRISGYPKAPGSWTFTVRVQDASVPKNEAVRTLTLTIA